MAKIATTQTKNGALRSGSTQSRNRILDESAEIQQLAYQFFVERGFEHGHDHEDWLRAEAVVKNRKRS